jgi:hypothetical protein
MNHRFRDPRDRRAHHRAPRRECRRLTVARLRPGRDVDVVNLSSGGALVETGYQLLPGTGVVLSLAVDGARCSVHGRVLRCHVFALHPERGVFYRAAVGFDACLVLPGLVPFPGGKQVPEPVGPGPERASNHYP